MLLLNTGMDAVCWLPACLFVLHVLLLHWLPNALPSNQDSAAAVVEALVA